MVPKWWGVDKHLKLRRGLKDKKRNPHRINLFELKLRRGLKAPFV